MKLEKAVSFLLGRRFEPPTGQAATHSQCPHEVEILAYFENRLTSGKRARLESHFGDCELCREALALFVQIPGEGSDQFGSAPLSEDDVTRQAARVRAMIAEDEFNRSKARREFETATKPARAGFNLSFLQLAAAAVVFLTIAAGAVLMVTRGLWREDSSGQSLASIGTIQRQTEGRVSQLQWSRSAVTKGEDDRDESQFKLALRKLSLAEDRSAPAKDRMYLARLYLKHARGKDSNRALEILHQLVADGVASPEVFNDTGVALMQLEKYDEAIIELDKALQKNPGFEDAMFNKALAEQRAGRIEDAKRDWNLFINTTKDRDWKQEAQDHLRDIG